MCDQQLRFLHICGSQEGWELWIQPEGQQRHLVYSPRHWGGGLPWTIRVWIDAANCKPLEIMENRTCRELYFLLAVGTNSVQARRNGFQGNLIYTVSPCECANTFRQNGENVIYHWLSYVPSIVLHALCFLGLDWRQFMLH